jgi:hypothetical protein
MALIGGLANEEEMAYSIYRRKSLEKAKRKASATENNQ